MTYKNSEYGVLKYELCK